jgi:putative NADH-flavin reductase
MFGADMQNRCRQQHQDPIDTMRLLILGATGRTGGCVVAAARAAGHHTTAFGRRAAELADRSLTGGFDTPAFAEAVQSADAVLSCLASTNTDDACSRAAAAALRADAGVRYLTVAGAGVDRPTDAKGLSDRIIGRIMRVVAGRMLADRQREVDMLAASSARWTALRPPRLTTGRATGRWVATFDRPAATWIDRQDLAAAMIAALDDPAMINRAPFVAAGGKA